MILYLFEFELCIQEESRQLPITGTRLVQTFTYGFGCYPTQQN